MSVFEMRWWWVSAWYYSFIIKDLLKFLLTISTSCYRSPSTPFLFDILDSILQTLWIMIFTHSLLMYFYMYQDSLKENICSFSHKDHADALFVTFMCIGLSLAGNAGHAGTSSDQLEEFFANPLMRLLPLKLSVYNDNDDDFELDIDYYQSKYKNARLHRMRIHKKNLPNVNADNTTQTQSSFNDHTTNANLQASWNEINIPLKHGFFVKNIDNIDQHFICPSCHLVLRQPYQLRCGHRQCQSCIEVQNDTIRCSSCFQTSMIDEAGFDKVFQDELERLSILCTVCDWTGSLKTYQEHIEQNHSNRFLTCSFCRQQVDQSKIQEHYLTASHQLMLLNILCHLQLTPADYDRRQNMRFAQLHNALSIVSDDAAILDNTVQQISNELCLRQQALQLHNHELSVLKLLAQDVEIYLNRMRNIHDFCFEEILSLKQQFNDRQIVVFDGTSKWKISSVQQKMYDAQFDRQRSIYSPYFYSSLTGYKMRLRLFLNGINNARDTHMSIFFILMRGEYDAILEWPFRFKVTFSLITDDDHHHFTNFFWPNARSICFERPWSEMNAAYGIEKFISLDEFQENHDEYVRDDTMFVNVEVDFLSKPPEIRSDSGEMLLKDEQHTDTNDDDLMRKFLFLMERSEGIH